MNKLNLFNYSQAGLAKLFESWGEKSFRATQLLQWIYQKDCLDFDAMSNFSLAFREKLKVSCEFVLPEIVEENVSPDGTIKWLMRVDGKNVVESVFIPEPKRATVCLSSQAGCMLNCTFCSTGTQGFACQLSTAQIIGQLWLVKKRVSQNITNVVMMGMGEPLLNFDHLVPALALMRSDYAFGIAKRKLTVSTSGVVPNIGELAKAVDVALAISLHAPDNALRNHLVPINRKYPLEVLLASCRDYLKIAKQDFVTMEYVMLKGVNDSLAQAKQLVRLLSHTPCKINLIPFNPFPGTQYQCSDVEQMSSFKAILVKAGFVVTVRKTRGEKIQAACGQLVGDIEDRTKRQAKFYAKLYKSSKECVNE